MHSASWFLGRTGSIKCHNQTRGEKQGCSRADDIAASSVGRSPPSRTRPRRKNHQFCARPGAFTSMGSRLNLYCSAGRRRRGRGGHRSGSGSRGGKGARASRVVGTSSARARASPRANPRTRSRGRTAPSWVVAFPRSDTLNLGGGHSRSAGCGPWSTTCGSSWVAPSSSYCAREG